jgi:hypothetical protein
MKVINEIEIREINGNEVNANSRKVIRISSTESIFQTDKVVLEVAGNKYTVLACELEAAVKNASNKR